MIRSHVRLYASTILMPKGFYPDSPDTSIKPIMGQEVCHGNTQEVLSGVQAQSRPSSEIHSAVDELRDKRDPRRLNPVNSQWFSGKMVFILPVPIRAGTRYTAWFGRLFIRDSRYRGCRGRSDHTAWRRAARPHRLFQPKAPHRRVIEHVWYSRTGRPHGKTRLRRVAAHERRHGAPQATRVVTWNRVM